MCPNHRAVVAGLRWKAYSLSKRPHLPTTCCLGPTNRPIGVNCGYWLLHEMQGPARNQKCQTDNHEEWSASNRGCLPSVRDQDLQNRRWHEVAKRVLSTGGTACSALSIGPEE